MAGYKYEIDMSKGSLFRSIVWFALPLIFTNVLQILYNAADIIVVGRWAGMNRLAAVGATGALNSLLINVFIGVSIGAGVVVSQRYGAHDREGVQRAVHTAMFVGIILGVLSFVLGEVFCKTLLRLMGTPDGNVLDGASLYMRIWFIGAPASLIYNFGSAVLRAVGDTKRPLFILSVTGLVNVCLNLYFVIVCKMGVEGVAIATVVANYMSAAAVLYTLSRSDGAYRLAFKKLTIHKEELTQILKIGMPAGLQSSVFGLSNVVIQSAVNSFGTAAIAGSASANNIEAFVYTAMNSLCQAAITAVSQNYGAGDEKRINRSIYTSLICVTVVGIVLGPLTVLFGKQLLSIYIVDSLESIAFGYTRMMFTCTLYFLCGIMDVLAGSMRGLGYSAVPAVNSLVGACGFRIIWIFFVLPLKRTPEVLFSCWPLSWICVIIMHILSLLLVKKRALKKKRI